MQIMKINAQLSTGTNNTRRRQNQMYSPNNSIQSDTVSFGMARLRAPEGLQKLLESNEYAKMFFRSPLIFDFTNLKKESDEVKKAFLLFRDTEDMCSPVHVLGRWKYRNDRERLNVYTKLVALVKSIDDPKFHRKWLLLKNGYGVTPLNILDEPNQVAIMNLADNLDIKARRAFHLVKNKNNETQFVVAQKYGEYQIASALLDSLAKLDEKTQKAWIGMNDGNTYKSVVEHYRKNEKYFDKSLIYIDSANKLLELVAKRTPKRLIKMVKVDAERNRLDFEIPEQFISADSFIPVAEAIANNEELSKAETLQFLRQYNKRGRFDRLITYVKQNAID